MHKLLLCFILAFSCTRAFPQFHEKRLSIDSIRSELQRAKSDSARVSQLLELSYQYLIKPGELPVDLDSAMLLARQASLISSGQGYKTWLGLAAIMEGRIWREKGDFKRALPYFYTALKLFEQAGMNELTGEAQLLIGQHYSNDVKDIEEKIKRYLLGYALFKKAHAVERQAGAAKDLGDLYMYKNEYSKAADYLHESLKLYESIHFGDIQGIYNLMGRLYRSQNNYKLALKYGLLAVDAGERLHDTTLQLGALYNHLGLTYFELNKYHEAEICFAKSLKNAIDNKDAYTVQTVASNLADALSWQNRRQEAVDLMKRTLVDFPAIDEGSKIRVANKFVILYLKLNDLKNAKIYCDYLVQARKNLGETDNGHKVIYLMIIRYFIQAKDYAHAYHYLALYHKYIEKTRSVSLLHRSTEQYFWFQADSASRKYLSAINHYRNHKILSDSVFNAENSDQIARLQIEFDSEKKDKDLKAKAQNIALLENKDQLNQTRLQKAELMRNTTLGGLLALAGISGLLYFNYRSKQIANRKLVEQQKEINQQNSSLMALNSKQEKLLSEKEWLLKEIHHRVKNNLQIVISLLNTQCFYMENATALNAIRESQHRVHTISLIHKKLYQGDSYGAINMLNYVHELIDYLKESFDIRQNIRFKLKVDELLLDVSQAVPIGLILNEAVTNCLKYAFPADTDGMIIVVFVQMSDLRLSLTISDNGIGLPENFGKNPTGSLGMNMIQGLSTDMDGTCEIETLNGTAIKIELPYDREFLNSGNLATLLN